MKKKAIAGILIAAVLFTAYFVYSWPKTLLQLYPMLTLDKCTEISGYYIVGTQTDPMEFVIEKDSPEFEKLFSQFYWKMYRRSVRDILPRSTRYHTPSPEDFQWDVCFSFEDVEFPDGSIGSGKMLHFHNWYGDLDIGFNGETYSCHTDEQEAWAETVLQLIQRQ